MKKYLIALVFGLLTLSPLYAQQGVHSHRFTIAGPDSAINLVNTAIAWHQLTWSVSGTASTCTVALDTSTNGTTWTAGGAITGQTCTSNGSSSVVNIIANYVRINMTALTITGGSSVTVTWDGWTSNPGGGGGSTPRLDQVLDPNTSKIFLMGANALTLRSTTAGAARPNFTVEGNSPQISIGSLTDTGAGDAGRLFFYHHSADFLTIVNDWHISDNDSANATYEWSLKELTNSTHKIEARTGINGDIYLQPSGGKLGVGVATAGAPATELEVNGGATIDNLTANSCVGTDANKQLTNTNCASVAWSKVGPVISGGNTAATTVEEPSAFITITPKAISNIPTGQSVLGMWYTVGFASTGLDYAESLDGVNWVFSAFTIATHAHSCVSTISGHVYLLAADASSGANDIDIYDVTDPSAITTVKTHIVSSGTGPAWKANSLGNCGFWHDTNGTYYLLYEGQAAGGNWSIGLATCTAPGGGMTCTDGGSNPVISNGTGSISDPKSVRQISSNFYITWLHATPTGVAGVLPSDGYFATAASPSGPWTVSTNPVLFRTNQLEGVNTATGQLADLSAVTFRGSCYMFDGAFPNGNNGLSGAIELSITQGHTCESFTGSTTQTVAQPAPTTGLGIFNPPLRNTAGAVALTNGTHALLGTVTLTPGTWTLQASAVYINTGSTTLDDTVTCISTSNSSCSFSVTAFPETYGITLFSSSGLVTAGGFVWVVNTNTYTVTVTASTAYYAVGLVDFTAGAVTSNGVITAQRIY